jgi:hypothetical protein
MGFVCLGGSGMSPRVGPPDRGPASQQPGWRPSASEENRRIEQQAHDRAEAAVPPLFRAAVWLGVIGVCFMLFDVIPGLGGTLTLVSVWGPMLGIPAVYAATLLAFALRARRRRSSSRA